MRLTADRAAPINLARPSLCLFVPKATHAAHLPCSTVILSSIFLALPFSPTSILVVQYCNSSCPPTRISRTQSQSQASLTPLPVNLPLTERAYSDPAQGGIPTGTYVRTSHMPYLPPGCRGCRRNTTLASLSIHSLRSSHPPFQSPISCAALAVAKQVPATLF